MDVESRKKGEGKGGGEKKKDIVTKKKKDLSSSSSTVPSTISPSGPSSSSSPPCSLFPLFEHEPLFNLCGMGGGEREERGWRNARDSENSPERRVISLSLLVLVLVLVLSFLIVDYCKSS